jgi:transposase, IS30 family
MADHARFTINTGVHVYFCDPRSPPPRGSNENTNGLLRQYFPKRTEIAHDEHDPWVLSDYDAPALPCSSQSP